jgi:hypothetical protein
VSEKRRDCYADLLVRGGGSALGRRDIRTPLKNGGRHVDGTAGGVALSGDRGIENIDAGWPTSTAIACSNCARATPLSMAAACADCNYVCA